MPKQKSTKGLVKRVRVTRKGKVLARGCGSVHRRAIKSAKQKRRLYKNSPLHPTAAKAIRKVLAGKR